MRKSYGVHVDKPFLTSSKGSKIIYGLDWYTPSDKVLAHTNCFSLYNLWFLLGLGRMTRGGPCHFTPGLVKKG